MGSWWRVRLVDLGSRYLVGGWYKPNGFLWIECDHSYEGMKSNCQSWKPNLLYDAQMAFHDSTDPDPGPLHLIGELVQSAAHEQVWCEMYITQLKNSK